MEIQKEAWTKFTNEFDFSNENTNFKIDFKQLTKKFGNAYIEFCKDMWAANDGVLSKEEFMQINGNMPESFFNKVIYGRVMEIGKA